MKKFRPWLIAALVFQLLTGFVHSISFFIPMQATQESEKLLVELFTSQKLDMGAGFSRTLYQIFMAVSISFSLLFLFGGFLNWFLVRKKISTDIIRTIISIQSVIFGICFITTMKFAFLPPIILTGITFLLLAITRLSLSKSE